MASSPSVVILLGSKSDLKVAEKCTAVLTSFGVSFSVRVASAHRSPKHVEEIVAQAEASGTKVFVAIAGLAAALPGAVASLTTKPVIGVPVGGSVPFDSLLAIAQLPPGVPSACVGVDRGDNAGHLAVQILGLQDETLANKLREWRKGQVEAVKQMDVEVQAHFAASASK
eukprot:c9322_g2_i1.p1 GENE.c9322_g2_i1~~c9322_g2_i1.p1  ORF type:complete len:185 (+),score=58.35 c9322_g2_i1:47-556(+)